MLNIIKKEIIKVISIVKQIFWGYYYLVFTNSSIKFLSDFRKAQCSSCEYRGKYFGCIDKCNKCGCVIEAKIRSIEAHCPIGKW